MLISVLYRFLYKICTFLPKYLVSSFFRSTFAANIPIVEYGLGCPRLEGLSVLAVLFLFVRYNFYAYLFQVFSINSFATADGLFSMVANMYNPFL